MSLWTGTTQAFRELALFCGHVEVGNGEARVAGRPGDFIATQSSSKRRRYGIACVRGRCDFVPVNKALLLPITNQLLQLIRHNFHALARVPQTSKCIPINQTSPQVNHNKQNLI